MDAYVNVLLDKSEVLVIFQTHLICLITNCIPFTYTYAFCGSLYVNLQKETSKNSFEEFIICKALSKRKAKNSVIQVERVGSRIKLASSIKLHFPFCATHALVNTTVPPHTHTNTVNVMDI